MDTKDDVKKHFSKDDCFDVTDFKKWSGKRVLYIGCGIGTDSINFVKNGADLTIVEFSDKSLDVCKKKFEVIDVSIYVSANVDETKPIETKTDEIK